MRLTKFRKYITWNIASLIGYICIVIMFVFLLLLIIASSGTTIREDVNEYFYNYIIKFLLIPYIKFYSFQIFLVVLLMIMSYFENKYYVTTEQYGKRFFDTNENLYSIMFITGIFLNIVPLCVLLIILFFGLIRFI